MEILKHFDLERCPFQRSGQLSYYAKLDSQLTVIENLIHCLNTRDGMIKVTGEVGSGKTVVCQQLIELLNNGLFVPIFIANPSYDPNILRKAIAAELGADVAEEMGPHSVMQQIYQACKGYYDQGKRVVLVVDEAQLLSTEGLELLRLMTNMSFKGSKLLQVVFFAQPTLDERLKAWELRHIQQRICFSCQLSLLSFAEFKQYMEGRLSAAGCRNSELFSLKALRLIYKKSLGVPRIINHLAHLSMLSAYKDGQKKVGKKAVLQAVAHSKDLLRTVSRRQRYIRGWLLSLVVVVLIFLIAYLLRLT
jgi:MSHA biogenesis protein MshM